ncbi:MMPL family transporter [Paenibacillus larvae]
MKHIIRLRWIVLAVWIAAAVLLMWQAPDMAKLVREKGQLTVPDGYPSKIAGEILDKHSSKEKGVESFIVVFHSKEKLTDSQLGEIENTVNRLKNEKDRLNIESVTTHFGDKDLESQLVSKDGKTVMTLLNVKMKGKEVKDVRKPLEQAIHTKDVDAYMTGNSLINEDVVISSEKGLAKTEVITVIFILIVLILVFRSVMAPLIPLLTVGMTYLISQSVVAFLIDRMDFPVSTFTQTFLVAVLFGIGTDYCILLLSRYKEELSDGNEVGTAILNTYKTAGKTVIFSGLAVMVGFASIGFASFKLYQSAVGVAVGVFVLLVALFTLVPFFMATLKKGLFWPVKKDISHSQSRIWGWMGKLSIIRPLIALGIVGILTIPLLISYDGELSFNSLDEIGNEYDSVKAFNIVSDSFGPGEVMPVQIVLENDDSMKNKEYLTIIEMISNKLEKLDHVNKVRAITRPMGDKLEEIYVKKQADEMGKGIEQGTDGINTIKNGLNDASKTLQDNKPQLQEATGSIGKLTDGTKGLQSGIGQLQTALGDIEKGIRSGSSGAARLKEGVKEAQEQALNIQQKNRQLLGGLQAAESGFPKLVEGYNNVSVPLQNALEQLMSLEKPLQELMENHPEIAADPNFQQIQGIIHKAARQVAIAKGTVSALNPELDKVQSGLQKANAGLTELTNGLGQYANGMQLIIDGLGQLQSGMDQAANGQNQVIGKIPEISKGLDQIASGQQQLQTGFGKVSGQLDQLTQGLSDSSTGLAKIGDGLDNAQNYLEDLSKDTNLQQSGINIPDQLLKDEQFQRVFDVYMSKDGKMTTVDVILDTNPYSNPSMKMIHQIEQTVKEETKGTKLENAHVGIGGITSTHRDLETMSNSDYNKTVTYMMIGIVLVLIILLRSLIMPVYLIVSLLLTYYSSIAVTEIIFVDIMGYPGINCETPFFGFVMLMALGVDYSIFLMARFSEYKELDVKTGILLAMKNMGTVIMSAAIILAGTFAAMLPSGVLSMLQIATVVLTGLLFYALIILPLFVPVLISLLGKANWWPFTKRDHSGSDHSSNHHGISQ